MSAVYTSQGTITATAIVTSDPDRSGNFWCDSTADDVEIQAAIVYVGALGGGSVHVAKGTYSITAVLSITVANTVIEGEGFETEFFQPNGQNLANIFNVTASYVWFFRFYINGNRDNNTTTNGITYTNVSYGYVAFVHVRYMDGTGIQAVTGGGVHWIVCCRVQDCDVNCVRYASVSDSHICFNDLGGATFFGIGLSTVAVIEITGNNIFSNDSGIDVFNARHVTIEGGTIHDNDKYGIRMTGATGIYNKYNIIDGVLIYDNSQDGAGSFSAVILSGTELQNNIVSNCLIRGANQTYGVEEADGAYDNLIEDNNLTGNHTGGLLLIGTGTRAINNKVDGVNSIADGVQIPTLPITLIQGTTFISTAGEAWGWEIDADTEFALGIGWLPLEVQQVVRIRVIGVGLASPPAAAYMRIQITGEGATFDEVFTTEPIDVVDKNNEEANFAIDDVINWVFDATDDADIGHLLGGDRLQIKVLHEGGAGDDIETNAIVDSIQVEYV